MRMHSTSVDLKCNICDRTFENEDLLKDHKLTHSKTLVGTGNPVDVASPLPSAPLATCAYCKLNIENEQQFKEHFKRHNNIGQNNSQPPNGNKSNSFMCIVCRQVLTSNNEYHTHMKHHLRRSTQPISINSNKDPLKCPVGEENMVKTSSSSDLAAKDEARYTNGKATADFLCEICSSKFESNVKLQAHLLQKHEHNNQQAGVI